MPLAAMDHGKATLGARDGRQGKEPGVIRHVLNIGLALSVIAGIVIYAILSP